MPRLRPRFHVRPFHARDLRRGLAGLLALSVVWVGVGLTVQAARAKAPQTAEVVQKAKRVTALPADPQERAAQLQSLVQRVQRLSLDDRLDPELIDAVESAVAEMTPEEQRGFVRDLLPPGLDQMARAFAAMDDEQKRLATDRLRREFKHNGWLPADTDRQTFSALIDTSMSAFLETDDPEAQLDLLPMMQQILQAMRSR
ncbi:MAG: hypothetical protein AAF086_04130 [Planctomycetota bacterium]